MGGDVSELQLSAHELEQLAETANKGWDSFSESLDSAALEAGIIGKALSEAKESVGHGQWLNWLTTYCPKIHPRKAQKLMEFANTTRAAHLTDEQYRQAFQEIFSGRKQIATTTESQQSSGPVLTVQGFARRADWITSVAEGEAIAMIQRLSDQEKKMLGEKVTQAEHALGVVKVALNTEVVEV
jgi:cell division septum initiation protein DivIVA